MFFLPYIFFIPLLSALFLFIQGKKLTVRQLSRVSVGSIVLSTFISLGISLLYLLKYSYESSIHINLFSIFDIAFDNLNLVLIMSMSCISCLIQIFSVWYIKSTDTNVVAKYYAYLNLLVASILFLILSNNLLAIYLAIESITICFYLLMSLNSKKNTAIFSADTETILSQKSLSTSQLILSRFGDLLLLSSFILLFKSFNTLQVSEIVSTALSLYTLNHADIVTINMLLVAGILIKSLQLPLRTWFLIQQNISKPAMVLYCIVLSVIGVYLVARLHTLLLLTPDILFWWVAVIASIVLTVISLRAVLQKNISSLLIYACMIQVCYAFIALGMSAWHLAIAQLTGFIVISCLLLLTTTVLLSFTKKHEVNIHDLHNVHNIHNLAGLKDSNPLILAAMVVGIASLICLPIINTFTYSQEIFLFEKYTSVYPYLFYAVLLGLCLSASYGFKVIHCLFFNDISTDSQNAHQIHTNSNGYKLPLFALMILLLLLVSVVTLPLFDVFPQLSKISGLIDSTAEKINITTIIIFALLAIIFGITTTWYCYVINERKQLNTLRQTSFGHMMYMFDNSNFGLTELHNNVKKILNQSIKYIPIKREIKERIIETMEALNKQNTKGYMMRCIVVVLLSVIVSFFIS